MIRLEYDPAQEYLGKDIRKSREIRNLEKTANMRLFECYAYRKGNTFILDAFPWVWEPEWSDLKEDKTKRRYKRKERS